MQNILLDILIIGLLVILFGSIYRKHATVRVRFWLLGWFFILIHFGLLLVTPPDAWGAKLMLAAAEGALLLCGASFALSSELVWEAGMAICSAGAAAEHSAGCVCDCGDVVDGTEGAAAGFGRRLRRLGMGRWSCGSAAAG